MPHSPSFRAVLWQRQELHTFDALTVHRQAVPQDIHVPNNRPILETVPDCPINTLPHQ